MAMRIACQRCDTVVASVVHERAVPAQNIVRYMGETFVLCDRCIRELQERFKIRPANGREPPTPMM